jgi:hypothetical protein
MSKTLSNGAIPAQEKKWRAESDAHTLAEAKTITSDKSRHQAAVKMAGTMANEKMNQAKAMKAVASKKIK